MYNDTLLAAAAASDLAVYDHEWQSALNVESLIGLSGRTVETALFMTVPKHSKRRVQDEATEQATKRLRREFYVGMDKQKLDLIKPYQEVADRLKDTKQVNEVVEAVAAVQQHVAPQMPFIVLESSSGMGKTQMAFNLMARDDIDVVYINCASDAINPQSACSVFAARSRTFKECVAKDVAGMRFGDEANIRMYTQLRTYAFIYALLNGLDTCAKYGTSDEVKKTLRERKTRTSKHCSFFLDEFPIEEPSQVVKLRFMRNIFRSLGLPVILSSTNGTARNLFITCSQSSRRSGEKTLWCIVFPSFPQFRDPYLDCLGPGLRWIIQHSRPLFARMAIDYIRKTSPDKTTTLDGAPGLVEFMDRMTADLGLEMFRAKGNSRQFRCGQLRLFIDVNYVHANCDDLVEKHYARLRDDARFLLSIPEYGRATSRTDPKAVHIVHAYYKEDFCDGESYDIVKDDEFWPWRCETSFPALDTDVLLYLCLMGGKHFHAFAHKGYPISISTAYTSVEAILPLERQRRLEELTAAAIVLASHQNGFAGITFTEFLRFLLWELDMQESRYVRVSFGTSVEKLLSTLNVPYLAPSDVHWPDFLEKAALNLGRISCGRNRGVYEASLLDGRILVECKDYQSRPISSKDMNDILARVQENEQTVVRLVLMTKFEEKDLLGHGEAFGNSVSRSVNLCHTHFYRVGIHKGAGMSDTMGNTWRNDLVPIVGVENKCCGDECIDPRTCSRVDKVVIFMETRK